MRKIVFSLAYLLSLLLASCAHTLPCEAKPLPVFESPITVPISWSFTCTFPEDKRDLIREATNFWNEELGWEVFIERDSCDQLDALNSVVFYYNATKSRPDEEGTTLGVTMRWHFTSHLTTGATIVMFRNWYDEPPEVAGEVARHELGHVLGFNHMKNTSCLMYKYVGDGTKGLCAAEKKIIERVYGKDRRHSR